MRATSLGHAGMLVETDAGSVVCDPWFLPAFFGSWFVFPRNDRLAAELMTRVEGAEFLYISHLHADHLDEPWLADHIDRSTTVLLPGFPSDELEQRLRALGFTRFVHTSDGEPVFVGRNAGLEIAIHVETAITDGPGGDSAIVISDGRHRLVNQNDCRPHDPGALGRHGPVDAQWLQFSGAIWYPMVYEEPTDRMRELCAAKVESQYARTLRYVEAVGAKVVVPSAGPPAFLDPDLFAFNVIDGDEVSIFPDATDFLRRLEAAGVTTGQVVVPGATLVLGDEFSVEQPDDDPMRPYREKRSELERYAADWAPWLEAHKATWHEARPGLVERIRLWWEPLLEMAPSLSAGVGGGLLLQAGDEAIYVDFTAGRVAAHDGQPYRFRFDIPRALVETVVDRREIDWSNALFLSCRFRAWRAGPYNEYLYNFLKSLSPDRMARAEAEAAAKLATSAGPGEEIRLGGYLVQRWCPHRRADLKVFGEVVDGILTCTLHGWCFELATGRCLTADDHRLRARPAL